MFTLASNKSVKKFEKVNQSNIFLYHVYREADFFLQIHNILENPQISNMNSDFVPASTVSQQREAIPIFVALEQGLDTSVCKRVFKPPRLKSQI